MDVWDKEGMADDDDAELYESMEKRIRDRIAGDEALDALYAKQNAREQQRDDNLEGVTNLEQRDIDYDDDDEDDEEEDGAERALNLEAFESPLREWISEERTRREIHRRFKKFLLTYYVGIEEITHWQKRHGDELPLPPHMKRSPPYYPPLIK